MKPYKILLETTALRDIEISYVWGRERWGTEKAKKWYRAIKGAIKSLANLPERYPLAPELELEDLGEEVRQMVFQRYRILFTIKKKTVHVLHIRGAYHEDTGMEDEQ